MNIGICPECGDAAFRRSTGGIRPRGWVLGLPESEDGVSWEHADRTPLCPVMTSSGYQPARPVRA